MAELSALDNEDKDDFYRLKPLSSTLAENIAYDVGYEVPEITAGPGYAEFSYASYGVIAAINNCTTAGEAEIKVWVGEGELTKALAWQHIRLMSQNSLAGLIKDLQKQLDHIPWDNMVKYCAWKAVQLARQGQAVQEIWASQADTLAPTYVLEPILYLNHPTVIFGDYGSLKSSFALVIGYVAQLPYSDNKLGLTTGKESTHCLYLDYEDDPSSFRKRWSAIERGFGIDAPMPMLYRRMTSPLADSVENLQHIIGDNKTKLLIIDSLGPAARGNLNEPEPAIRYHDGLRKLGITSLTLAHCAKDQLTKKRTIFGSVFFTNLARSVWECKAEQETGEDEAIISLKHTKANLSRLHPPLGYKFTFTDNSISVVKTDLRDTGLSGELPLSWQIKNLLKQGSLTIKEISEQLNSKEDTIGRTLRRMRKNNQAVKLEDNTWGLAL